jgi:hypothetical protein
MKNYTPLLKERWDKGWPAFKEYYTVNHNDGGNYNTFRVNLKEEYGGKKQRLYSDIYELVDYSYEPVPEEVACMALKMLSEENEAFKIIGDYTISRKFEVDYQDNVNELDILFRGEYVISISWRHGEHVQNIRDEGKNIDTLFGEHNIFDISGYYEARNFGFSWHKE